ncbi:F-box/kelch-repeat protein At3g23880-like [Chenopodium quinoa]|uniref:F-box/kelch-repeat protein At3g23880-like n=1 Tax=Chenopodium quinoa TaxID=63459 RepID=UPI000B77278B|nr:F-box/kelch-repeat protein At3g23880-like [Chenopodium quinoa]
MKKHNHHFFAVDLKVLGKVLSIVKAYDVDRLTHRRKIIKSSSKLTVIGSCDGLICMYKNNFRKVYVWNPTTKECRRISTPKGISNCICIFGLAYVPSIDDYKIMLISDHTLRAIPQVHVYSLKDNKWRKLEEIIDIQVLRIFYQIYPTCFKKWPIFTSSEGVYFDEALYWISDHFVLRFDLVKESFDLILNSKIKAFKRKNRGCNISTYIQVIGVNLCVCLICNTRKSDNQNQTSIKIWMFEQSKCVWKNILKGKEQYMGGLDYFRSRIIGIVDGKLLILEEIESTTPLKEIVLIENQPLGVCIPEESNYVASYDESFISPYI